MIDTIVLECEVDTAIQKMNNFTDLLSYADAFQPFMDNYTPSKANDRIVVTGLDAMAKLIGLESHVDLLGTDLTDVANLELSLEGIGNLPKKVWKLLADAAHAIIERLRALYNLVRKRFFDKAEKTDQAFSDFEKRLTEHDELIRALKIEPGSRLTGDQEQDIKDMSKTIFLSPQGKVLSRAEIEADLTKIVPPSYRGRADYLSVLAVDGKYGDLVADVSHAIEVVAQITAYGSRTTFLDYEKKLVNVTERSDLEWFFKTGLEAIEREDQTICKAINVIGKEPLTYGRPLIGGVYPTYLRESYGLLKMHTMVYSYTKGRQDTSPPSKGPKGFPVLSYTDAKKLRDLAAEAQTLWTKISSEVGLGNTALEALTASGGKTFEAANDVLVAIQNGRNSKDLEKLQALLKHIPKGHNMAFSYLRASEQYLRRLTDAINALLVMCMGK